ncbi:MAG: DUF4974 domain-containing protein [Draconibacterium sp.]|nr:DUF4974 domain-containing protein [Draconibacterium sp.]
MTKDIIQKFLNNHCTDAELDEVIRWANTEALNEESKNWEFDNWKNYQVKDNFDDDEKFSALFDKIQNKINLTGKQQKITESSASGLTSFTTWLTRAAAILLIPVLSFSLWFYLSPKSFPFAKETQSADQSWIEINAPDGARVKFVLPDGSSGWLNSGSKLKYPAAFVLHRKVELEGEGYFEVNHLDNSDFTVSVADLDIKALGTKFNVSAYPVVPFTDVVLMEGKVEIDGKAGVFNHVMLPNEKISFNREIKSLTLNTVNANNYSAWKDGCLIIDNETLGQAAWRIERWYNAKIIIQDEKLNTYRFKATFIDEPIEEVLKLIAKTTPIKYKIDKREFDSNGVLKQKKITIKLK